MVTKIILVHTSSIAENVSYLCYGVPFNILYDMLICRLYEIRTVCPITKQTYFTQ